MNDRPNIKVAPPLVVLMAVIVGGILSLFAPTQVFPMRKLRFAGLPLLLGGLFLGGAAVRQMRKHGTNVDPHKPVTALVTSGPYRYTRNPIYLGFTLVVAGLGLLANSLWFLPLVAGLVAVLQTQVIRYEEGYLERNFGDEYRSYQKQVRRWV